MLLSGRFSLWLDMNGISYLIFYSTHSAHRGLTYFLHDFRFHLGVDLLLALAAQFIVRTVANAITPRRFWDANAAAAHHLAAGTRCAFALARHLSQAAQIFAARRTFVLCALGVAANPANALGTVGQFVFGTDVVTSRVTEW